MKERLLFIFFLAFVAVWSCGRESEAQELNTSDSQRDIPGYQDVKKILIAMQPSTFDEETAKERDVRLTLVSRAIVNASKDKMDIAILLALGKHESYFAEYVGAGCHYPEGIPKGAGDCDKGKSRSYWQMKRSTCHAGWALPRGSDEAVFAFALCARKTFRGSLGRCKGLHPAGYWAGGFSGYAKSTMCSWAPAAKRQNTLFYYKQQVDAL